MIDDYLYQPSVDENEHIIASYYLKGSNLLSVAKALAVGQSIGNPSLRSGFETEKILVDHLAKILDLENNLRSKKRGVVRVAFPLNNFDIEEDGVTQILCTLMGGQMDIEYIQSCRLLDVQLPGRLKKCFKGPKFGLPEIKRRAGAENRPLLGGIIKPKTGMNLEEMIEVCRQLLEGGVDFIKEDEILGNPACCPFRERVKAISELVNDFGEREGREIFYAPCINSDYPHFIDRAKYAAECGAKAIHLNIWAGFGAYRALRELDLGTALFFQKSGDQVITCEDNVYSISWRVVCKLTRLIGVDFIHAGMWGGYLSDSREDLMEIFHVLRDKDVYSPTVPSLSCGSHPGLVGTTIRHFGTDLMMNVGGAIHGHPLGTKAGARAMRQAFDFELDGSRPDLGDFVKTRPELATALETWGYVDE